MATYPDYDSPLMRLLRILTRSFAIGNFFRVHVRMYWAAAILMPLLFLRWVGPAGGTTTEALLLSLVCCVGLFVVIWTHEMGHIACGWRFGIRTDLITLSPLGGVAHMSAPAPTPRAELLISLAGPAVHLIWLAVCWPLWKLVPPDLLKLDGWRFSPVEFTLWYLVTTNTTLLVFNLMPIFPLDGGRVLRALLSMRVHPNRATMWATTVGFVGGGALILMGLLRSDLESAIPFVIGLSCISACLNERRMARHVLVYQQAARAPWEADAEAWKFGGDPRAPRAKRQPGAISRWRHERAQRKAERAAEVNAELDREVDAILERVHQVGMTGLSEQEKAVLKRASQRRRGTG
ncbi:MAG: M50 family metallopeptidase [Planctomycetota bacterium]